MGFKLIANSNKRTSLHFFIYIVLLSIVFSLVIYLREASIKDQIDFTKVLLWQIIIWSPWTIASYAIPKIRAKLGLFKHRDAIYYGSGFLWICLHYGWFFMISSNYSPYLGMPATGYGVYPYFFIFWTLIDLMLITTIYAKGRYYSVIKATEQTKIKLTRGGEIFFCSPKDIHWFSSDNYYTHLDTIHGKFIMRNTLKHYYECLNSEDLIQIHRSTVVNVQYVKGLSKSNRKLFVVLADGSKKIVSRKNVSYVKTIFKNLMQ